MGRSPLACGAAAQVEPGPSFSYGQSCRRLVLFTSSKHFPNEQRNRLFIDEGPTEAARRARHEYEWEVSFFALGNESCFFSQLVWNRLLLCLLD